MGSLLLGHCRRSVGAKIPIHAAPTELGGPCTTFGYKQGAPNPLSSQGRLIVGVAPC